MVLGVGFLACRESGFLVLKVSEPTTHGATDHKLAF